MSSLYSTKSKQRRMRELNVRLVAGTLLLGISDSGVTNATDTFTSTAHGLSTGDRLLITEDNTLPSGLTTATQFWVIKSSADDFQLATTYANAIAGTNLSISNDGTGSNSYDLVEELAGLDLLQMSGNVQATLVGTYRINLTDTFFDANSMEVQVTSHTRDIVCSIKTIAADHVIIEVDDLDETAALKDGFFGVRIIGSDIEDRY